MNRTPPIFPTVLCLSLTLPLAASLATPATAQEILDRASGATSGLGGTFNQDAVESVVTPYETSAPDEVAIPHTQFEDRVGEIRAGSGQGTSVEDGQLANPQTRVLNATEDSYAIRPDVQIDGQGALFDDANYAHTNAEDIAARYFSSENGECTTTEIPVSNLRDEFCESFPRRELKTCTVTRRIEVDRVDTYRCDRRAASFVKLCNKEVSYSCQINTTANACIRENVRFPGATVSWSGNEVTVTVEGHGNGPASSAGQSDPGLRYAALAIHNVKIEVSDRFVPEAVVLREMAANGAMQLIGTDGLPVATAAGKPYAGFGSSGTFGGREPAQVPNDGLLLPHTHTSQNELKALIAKYKLSNYFGCNVIQSTVENLTVFQTGWDYTGSTIDQSFCQTEPGSAISSWKHPYYALIDQNSQFAASTFYTIPLEGFAAADPTGPKRFKDAGSFKVRMVYDSTLPGGPSAQFKLSFEGACCDSFREEGLEQCN